MSHSDNSSRQQPLRSLAAVVSAIVFAVSVQLAISPVYAQNKTYCSEPVVPFCTNRRAVFEDKIATARCRIEVDHYIEKMAQHAQCIEAQKKEVREKVENVEKRFACMEEGGADCG